MKSLIFPKRSLKRSQFISWIIASAALISSFFIANTVISFSLLVVGVSIFLASILTVITSQRYNGSFNFVMGSSIGFFASLPISEIVRNLRPGNLWTWVLILGWVAGGYLSVRDQVVSSDDVLDSPMGTGFAILGIFMATLFGLLIVSFIVSILFPIFGVSLPYIHSIILSFIIIHVTLVPYLNRKIFSEDLKKLEFRPNIHGTHGMFLGGVNGLMWSFLIGHLFVQNVDLSMRGFWIGAYAALYVGMVVGFLLGYFTEFSQK